MELSHRLTRPLLAIAPLVVAAIVAGTGVLLPTPAQAEPEPTLAEARRKVNELAEQMAQKNEEVNTLNVEVEESRGKQAVLDLQLLTAQAAYTEEQAKIGSLGTAAYETGPYGALNVMVGAKSTDSLLQQLGYLEIINEQQQSTLAAHSTAKETLADAKAAADAEVNERQEKQTVATAAKTQLEADLAHWEEKRNQLTPATINTPTPSASNVTTDGTGSAAGQAAASWAIGQVGKPYYFGAQGPDSFDCSGLTLAAWATQGVYMEHAAGWQHRNIRPEVDRNSLAAGDLVFYNGDGHVGVYIGNGQVVHAPQPGESVKVSGVDMMPFGGAVRPG